MCGASFDIGVWQKEKTNACSQQSTFESHLEASHPPKTLRPLYRLPPHPLLTLSLQHTYATDQGPVEWERTKAKATMFGKAGLNRFNDLLGGTSCFWCSCFISLPPSPPLPRSLPPSLPLACLCCGFFLGSLSHPLCLSCHLCLLSPPPLCHSHDSILPLSSCLGRSPSFLCPFLPPPLPPSPPSP